MVTEPERLHVATTNPVDEAERRRLAERQRLLLLAAIEADEARKNNSDDILEADAKFNSSMKNIGDSVKALEDGK